jgi:hypothetical protein
MALITSVIVGSVAGGLGSLTWGSKGVAGRDIGSIVKNEFKRHRAMKMS